MGGKGKKGKSGLRKRKRKAGETYVLADDSAETLHPDDSIAGHFVDEEAFAREHGFGKGLRFVLLDNSLGAGEKGVLANAPLFAAVEADQREVSETGWGEEEFARASVG